MWVQSITAFSFIFTFAVFAIILVLHSSGFDPDTKDVPKHLRALKTLAWTLTGLCIYYNAGAIQEPLLSRMRDVIFIMACVLVIGLWYISELPTWYQQLPVDQMYQKLPESQRQVLRGDLNLEEVHNQDPDDPEWIPSAQIFKESDARREIWKLQQRQRFSPVQNEPVPDFTSDQRAVGCGYTAYQHVERRKHGRSVDRTLNFGEVIWWIDPNDRTLRSVSDFTHRSQVCYSILFYCFNR